MRKVSGKTHTQEQLDHWANQHNPNNKAYQQRKNNQENPMNPKQKSHQPTHNSRRRCMTQTWPDWAPDYPEYND